MDALDREYYRSTIDRLARRFADDKVAIQTRTEDVRWAIECLEHYKNQQLFEGESVDSELWDWVDLLMDRARKLTDACID